MENYLEINFEKNMKILSQAIMHCERTLSHEEIIEVLKGDDDIEKQLRLIELKEIKSQEEADILVFNLTQHSGPVRETAAYKIEELIKNKEYSQYFQTKNIVDTFIKAITDINPTVSRSTIEIIKHIQDSEYIYKKILEEIQITLSKLDIETKNRSYVQNKKNFNLYWNLEALISISEKITQSKELVEILKNTATSNDYTIREKTAKVANIFAINEILEQLKQDTNVYVRKYT